MQSVQNSHVQGLACSATGWGPWAGAGMATDDPALLQRLRRQGAGLTLRAAVWMHNKRRSSDMYCQECET